MSTTPPTQIEQTSKEIKLIQAAGTSLMATAIALAAFAPGSKTTGILIVLSAIAGVLTYSYGKTLAWWRHG